MPLEEITKLLAGLGLGTGTGAVITAVINSRNNKGKARAEAADLLVGAAERVGLFNKELDLELRQAKVTLDSLHILIIDFLDGSIERDVFVDAVKELRK